MNDWEDGHWEDLGSSKPRSQDEEHWLQVDHAEATVFGTGAEEKPLLFNPNRGRYLDLVENPKTTVLFDNPELSEIVAQISVTSNGNG